MKTAIIVRSKPGHSSHRLALQVAEQLASSGNSLKQVFFYEDAVSVASSLNLPDQDDMQLTQRWQNVARKSDCTLAVCVAAATRRGVVSQEEAEMNELSVYNLAPGFELTGLGDWVEHFENHSQIKQLTFK